MEVLRNKLHIKLGKSNVCFSGQINGRISKNIDNLRYQIQIVQLIQVNCYDDINFYQ